MLSFDINRYVNIGGINVLYNICHYMFSKQ